MSRLGGTVLVLVAVVALAAARTCSVVNHGAVGDNATDCTSAVEAAIAECAGGKGTVLVPNVGEGRSVFRTRAFWLPAHATLEVESGAVLQAPPPEWSNNGTWAVFPPVYVRQASYSLSHASLVNVGRCLRVRPRFAPGWVPTDRDACAEWLLAPNVTLRGGGAIDGAGWKWWAACNGNPPRLPDNTSSPGNRPRLVEAHAADGLVVEGLTLRNSPSWTLHIVESENVRVRDASILSPPWPHSFNTDGVDLDSVRGAILDRLTVHNGDDAVALWAGAGADAAFPDPDGLPPPGPTEDVEVRDSLFWRSHGATVTEFLAGGVRRVVFRNITMRRPLAGPHVKAKRGFGGAAEDIVFEQFRIEGGTDREPLTRGWNGSGYAIVASMFTDCSGAHGGGNCPADPEAPERTPRFRNITVRDLTCEGDCWGAAQLLGLPDSRVQGLALERVDLGGTDRWECADVLGTASRVEPAPPAQCGLRSAGGLR